MQVLRQVRIRSSGALGLIVRIRRISVGRQVLLVIGPLGRGVDG